MRIRVVLDTNTAVSALLWRGVAHGLMAEAHRRQYGFWTSGPLLSELRRVLERPKFDAVFAKRRTTRQALLADYESFAHIVWPRHVPEAVGDDPSDNHVLACALEAKAKCVISGDKHLLEMGSYQNILMMRVGQFLREYAG